MQTLHPVLKRGALFWDADLLPRDMFETRFKRILEALDKSGDDAWLIYGDAQRYGDLAFASHYVARLRSGLLFVPREGRPVLLAAVGSRDIPATKALTWIGDVRPFGKLAEAAALVVREYKLENKKLGFVGARMSMPIADFDAFHDQLPSAHFAHRDAEYGALRGVHTLAERNATRRAASVVARGIQVAAHVFAEGLAVRQGTAMIDREMRRNQAEDVRILAASGPQTGEALRPPDERILVKGDTIMLYVAAETQRYWASAAQTLVIGHASTTLRNFAQNAARAVNAMQDAARPDVKAADVAKAAQRLLGGAAHHWASALQYGLGGGIGLDADEEPRIALDSTDVIERNEVLALNVVFHDAGIGAAYGKVVSVGQRETVEMIDHPPLAECRGPAAR